MRALLLAALLLPAVAQAQTVSPLVVPVIDTSNLATKAEVAAKANASALAALCTPAATIPPMEVVGGSAGSGNTCRLANAVQPRISRTVPFTTGAAGTATVAWADMGAIPLLNVQENVTASATNVPKCYPVIGTITATGATIKCYLTQSILGLGLVPFVAASSGVVGQVIAIPQS